MITNEVHDLKLDERLHHGGKFLDVVIAKFQADTYMCGALLSSDCHTAVSNDTDFVFLGGKDMLMVSSFKIMGRIKEVKLLTSITISLPGG